MAMQPASAAVSTAEYVTVSVAFCPGSTVKGAAGDQVNSVLVAGVVHRAIAVTCNVAVPVLPICAVSCFVAPTAMVPNSSDGGVTLIFGAEVVTPVPERATFRVACAGSFVVSTSWPLSVVWSVGAYVTVTVCACPAATLSVEGEKVYSALVPLPRATVPVRAAPPVFDTVMGLALLEPTVTSPNASVVGVTETLGDGVVVPVPETVTLVVGCAGSLLVTTMEPLSVVVSV